MVDLLLKNRKFTVAALTIIVAIVSTVIVLVCFNNILAIGTQDSFKQDVFIVPAQEFSPEIKERRLYLTGTVLLVFFLVIYYALFRRWVPKDTLLKKIVVKPGRRTLFISMLGIIAIITMISAALFGCFGLGAVTNSGIYLDHFNAVFHAMVQVYLGKALLIDLVNQYGLFPHFLEPIFRLIGLSVFKFSLTLSVIMFMSLLCLYLFLREHINDKFIALTGFMTIVFWGYLFVRTFSNTHDYFFQYYPIRFIFPMLLIYLAGRYLKTKSSLTYYLIFLLAISAVYWNFDSGIVVFLSWLGLLMYQALVRRDFWLILKHIINALILSAVILIFFSAYMFLRYGALPDFAAYFIYQQAYSTLGLYMMPMKMLHPWILIYGIYVVGAYLGVKAALEGEMDKNVALVVFITLIGFGTFVYYQGRSHDLNLLNVAFPAIILLLIYADQLTACLRQNKSRLVAGVNMGIRFFLIISTVGCVMALPLTYKIMSQRWMLSLRQAKTSIGQNTDYIAANSNVSKGNLILSMNSGIYYLAANAACPIKIPSPSELILKKDYNRLANYLQIAPKGSMVFYDQNFIYPEVEKYLSQNYNLIGSSPDGSIKKYVK